MLMRIWNWIKSVLFRIKTPAKLPENAVIPKPKWKHFSKKGKQHCKHCGKDEVKLYHWKGFDFCYQCCIDLRGKK